MEFLHRSLAFGISLIVAIVAVAGGIQFSYKTVDDSQMINQLTLQESSDQVLGASSNQMNKQNNQKCPETKPVIGWIDFRGKKTIQDTLPSDLQASSCFKDYAEANQAGFFR